MDEQGGRVRGVLDLVAGHYPSFLFGFSVGAILPVFHFHETTAEALEPAFQYLAENGYRTVVSDEASGFVRQGRHPGGNAVMLAFDDALASLWLVVGPLLERYGLRAVAYAIPSRIREASATRPTLAEGAVDAEAADAAENPFVTWPELHALSASGRVDVQSHTWSHAMVFTGSDVVGVVDRDFCLEHPFARPRLNAGRTPEFLTPSRLGRPMFPRRSRMSDGRRFWPDEGVCARIEAAVADRGGWAYFDRPGWREDLMALIGVVPGRWESDRDRVSEIEYELVASREELERRLKTPVRHVCLPWGVSGSVTRATLERLGVVTAFANRRAGRLAVASGDDPFWLKRLHSRHIFGLPGRGRRIFTTFV